MSAAACALVVACAKPAAVPIAPSPAPLHGGPLTDFVPSAGLRWLAVARLADLLRAPGLKGAFDALLPASRLDAFQLATGLDLRTVPSGLVAGFDLSTLYVAETPDESSLIAAKFVERLALGATRTGTSVQRIGGTAGGAALTMVRAEGALVAVTVGDPTPARVVELYLLGRLRRSPPALRGSALSTLPPDLESAPVRFYAPGPFSGAWTSGARGLLGATLACGASITPEGDAVRVRVVLSGVWEGEDIERLHLAWDDLAGSSLGKLLGLDQPEAPPDITVSERHLTLSVRLRLAPLVSGLRAAVVADVWEILRIPQKKGLEAPQKPP